MGSAKFRIPIDPGQKTITMKSKTNMIAKQEENRVEVLKKIDLVNFLIGQDLPPGHNDYKFACQVWLKKAFADASNWQIGKMTEYFARETKNRWAKSSRKLKIYLSKNAGFFSLEFKIPSDDNQAPQQTLNNGICLASKSKIPYLESYALSGFADTKLVSSDGYTIYLNRTVLAATSPLLRRILADFHSVDEICIITELQQDHLKMFRQFVTEGIVDKMDSRYMDRKIQEGLEVFGIDLNRLKMQTVTKEKDILGQEKQTCNGEALNVASELELVFKGEEFVRSEAIKHCIFNSFCVDLETLVQRLSGHYFKFHNKKLITNLAINTHGKVKSGSPRQRQIDESKSFHRNRQAIKKEENIDPLGHISQSQTDKDTYLNAIGQKKPNKRKQMLRPLQDEDEVPVKKERTLNDMVPLPLNDKGKKTQAQILFEEMMKNQDMYMDASDEDDDDIDDSIHICITCGKRFKYLAWLKEHKNKEGKFHNNKCPTCPGVEFKSWPEHQYHQNSAHNGVLFIICKYCPEAFETNKLRLKHIREDHDEKIEKIQCNDCGKLIRKKVFLAHQARHNAHKPVEKSGPVQCTKCSKWFDNKTKLTQHVYVTHKKFCCELCGMQVSRGNKTYHQLQFHTPEDKKPFVCQICTPIKGFISQRFFDEHMNIHDGIKPFSCKLCPNIAYANSANLTAHMRATHQGKKRKPKSN